MQNRQYSEKLPLFIILIIEIVGCYPPDQIEEILIHLSQLQPWEANLKVTFKAMT